MTSEQPVRHPQAPAPGEQIVSHYDLCFGCGAAHPDGLALRVWAEEQVSVRGEFEAGHWHQGAPGIAHGGILAAVMDELLGSLNWLLRAPAVTYRLETFFLRPVPVGQPVLLAARVTGLEGRKVYCEGEGWFADEPGVHVVRANGEFRQVPAEHFTRHGRATDVAAAASAPWRPAVGPPTGFGGSG